MLISGRLRSCYRETAGSMTTRNRRTAGFGYARWHLVGQPPCDGPDAGQQPTWPSARRNYSPRCKPLAGRPKVNPMGPIRPSVEAAFARRNEIVITVADSARSNDTENPPRPTADITNSTG